MTLQTPGLGERIGALEDGSFDLYDPANVSPLVAYLATEDCPFTGGVFHIGGNEVGLYGGWSLTEEKILATDGRWTVEDLTRLAPLLLEDRNAKLASVVTHINDTFKGYGQRKPTV